MTRPPIIETASAQRGDSLPNLAHIKGIVASNRYDPNQLPTQIALIELNNFSGFPKQMGYVIEKIFGQTITTERFDDLYKQS